MNTPLLSFAECYDYPRKTALDATCLIYTQAQGWVTARIDPGERTYSVVPGGHRIYAVSVLATVPVPAIPTTKEA